MTAKRNRPPNLIKLRFSDGVYAFWSARAKGSTKRITFRVKISGGGTQARTPEQRLEYLIEELVKAGMPEAALEYYNTINDYLPAEINDVVRWFNSHSGDTWDFIEKNRA